MLDQVEGRLKGLMEDASFRKELRDIATAEAGNADEAFVMAIAQKAIRQALDFSTGKAILTAVLGWIPAAILMAIAGV